MHSPVSHVFPFIKTPSTKTMTLTILDSAHLELWKKSLSPPLQCWVNAHNFKAEASNLLALPKSDHSIQEWLLGIDTSDTLYCLGDLSERLNDGTYTLNDPFKLLKPDSALLGFALGSYRFQHFITERKKKSVSFKISPTLFDTLKPMVESIFWVRDLINFPAESLGPSQLALEAKELAKTYEAKYKVIVGDQLLEQGYPLVHTVGRASDDAPRMVEITWGNAKHPKVSLVGKGVCFDSGGLDIKSADGMLIMRKDMGGAAHAMGLARLIMHFKLPIQLQLLLPMVENSISGHAYRPGDILMSRKGLSIEIGNTDAEGRLILADALARASESKPELIIDFATLTGAARIAMGPTIAALFSNMDTLADKLQKLGETLNDPLWRMPLYQPYKKLNRSKFADLSNSPSTSYGGAIAAALFLENFVGKDIPWAHFDIMAFNQSAQAGRPEGGEAMTLRAVFQYLKDCYA